MEDLFEIKPVDTQFYETRLKDFLPDDIIDIHTHVWLDRFKRQDTVAPRRTVTWPQLVAKDNSIEDLLETYRLLFPDKNITPMIFSSLEPQDDIDAANEYVSNCARQHHLPSLIFARPQWSAAEFEQRITAGRFLGAKVYLSMADPDIPRNEIEIFDFLPHHQLEVLDKHRWIAMLHIPRDKRLRDPFNLAQMLEIEQTYPNLALIIAHVGRAYCIEDVADAFEVLADAKRMLFDISANANAQVFSRLIAAVGPRRILFGSDMPILRMRTRRITENGRYINLVPKGLYGDVSTDPNMRAIEGPDAENLTFFMYEEIDAFRTAAEAAHLTRRDMEDIFNNNARRVIDSAHG
jgi:predicted TIM-barrel fold metal-dependent hydrolase